VDKNKLKSIVDAEIRDAIGFLQTETNQARLKAAKYYQRELYGNEMEGKSQVVTSEVADTVDAMLPSLIRVFASSDNVAKFEPTRPEDEETAKQATDYCNWIFNKDNQGFLILHHWFKDALLQKNGIVKVLWDDKMDYSDEEYEDLTDDQITMLMQDDDLEVVSQKVEEEMGMGIDPMTGQPMQMVYKTTDIKVRRKNDKGRVHIENVPPEEFIVNKQTRTLDDCTFCAHRVFKTVSDLVASGYDEDVVKGLSSQDDLTFNLERTNRFGRSEMPRDSSLDPSMRLVEVYECYLRVDEDEDGIAELRKIVYAGSEVLEDEEISYMPFAVLCPIPLPHKFFGDCPADRVMDVQLIKSTVTRQILDNLYQTNNSRMGAIEGQVNYEDLTNNMAGGIVRVKSAGAVFPLVTTPVAQQAFPLLQYFDDIIQKRTGLTDSSQGLNADVLQNVTAAAVAAQTSAATQRMELISRIFAETGVKHLFKCILHLVGEYQQKSRMIRLRGKWVAFDPREWHNEYDLSINVGLGTGNREQQISMLMMILQKQEQIMQSMGPNNPLVSIAMYRNTLARIVETAGFNDASPFLREISPEQEQMMAQQAAQAAQAGHQPQPPDPLIMAQIQALQAAAQADAQIKMQKAQAEIAIMQQKAQAEMELQQMKLQAQIETDRQKLGAEFQLKAAKNATVGNAPAYNL
jgi:hypothetical protein